MKPVIPFISRSYGRGAQMYLDQFAELMPEERIVLAHNVPVEERSQCDIAIVSNPDPKDVALFAQLKWVQSLWAGVEQLVAELNNPEFNIVRLIDPELTSAMSEAVLAWTLYLHRGMPAYALQQKQKHWQGLPYIRPEDRTVGILGLGELGQASAKRLVANGFNVIGWSRTQKQLSGICSYSGQQGLHSLLEKSQILICLLPLTDATNKLLDKNTLSLLPEEASVINFSRGAVINTSDLVDQLDKQHLTHAVLDVFDKEPLDEGSSLWARSDITILPHISAPTLMDSASKIVVKNIRHYRKTGTLPAVVDRMAGY